MLVTFSDTCGLRTFMARAPFFELTRNIRDEKTSTALPATVLAAVFPQVISQLAKSVVVGGVVVKGSLPARTNDAGVDQPLQVMAERGGRHVHVRLDRPRGGAI